MKFFVPAAQPHEVESVYANFAQSINRPVPSHGRRIAAIRYIHDGVEWTAKVGEQLTGVRTEIKRRKTGKVTVTSHVSDPAMVLAIFGGSIFIVITDAQPLTGKWSRWLNPFYAGQPSSVEYFESHIDTESQRVSGR